MGMDVHGKDPTSETGSYFRNNVWWWRPLWNYCYSVAPTLISERVFQEGHCNDGAGLNSKGASALAVAIQAKIDNGDVAKFVADYEREIAALPRQTCPLCSGTGIRCDGIGTEYGHPERVIDEVGHPRNGQKGWCNGCDGHGTKKHFDSYYRMSVENIAEFAAFLRDCGGFEIC